MQSADERVESIAEMIARLVCEYEARQAATEAKKSSRKYATPSRFRGNFGS
ncbi:hypothetical protein [Scytonema sp. NUACC21]